MKKLAALISASMLLASTSAMAEFYLGAKAGKSWLDDACTSTSACDDEDVTLGVFGGYQFWDFLSLEAGYDHLGKFDAAGLDDDSVQAFTLAPKLNLYLTDSFSVYGKFGGAYVDYGDENDASYLGAVGLQLDPHKKVAVRLEYQVLTDINNDIVRAEANSATLGVAFKFGAEEEPVMMVEEEMVVEEPVVMTKTYEASLLGSGLFALNSTELKPESEQHLGELVDFLNKYPQANVEIVGHTDSSGTEKYNQMISEKRAQSVKNDLMKRGISANRISARGEGESNPVADNSTREGRAKNRRVDVYVPEFEYTVEQ
ncbi:MULTISPECIES: OmpA family protein [unclassified Vibrio]|uniref:OmpA family protein n=1 Tax=unclassified Vibrio TaxID=2614977 RepID=UPI0013613CC7|nr:MULTISPECIES: OmpA family protein [unclassified Vibrio]NAW59775.1 OmpA family protein [Vibrio sp. V36_P2S2PM302]NAX25132.1 OmpA family protein [Vibrio sp. V38_P2S17PM301]NAX29276.1 OmpA family protein [Vibrio sp. V37_P2S8PM304]